MEVDRFSVTMERTLGRAVREAAKQSETSISGWLSAAASAKLRNDMLNAALDAWEAEDGPLTEDELKAASRDLGVGRSRAAR
jgi:hypothetical protein